MTTQQIDQAKAGAFAGQMLTNLNGAAVALMCSIGHKTGLFDTLSSLPPSTSQQIADAVGLNERYVREWLGAMVTGKIVEYDPERATYSLPPEHGAFLTRAAGPDNLAFFAVYLPLMGQIEEEVIECFKQGGGLSYDRYPNFQELQSEETTPIYDATLIQSVLPLAGVVERLEKGASVLDIGCGSGHAINLMAHTYPNSVFTGYDFSAEGVARAQAEAREWGLTNVRFEARDVTNLSEVGKYDFITAFDAIHDQAKPTQVLHGIARALKDDGLFLMVDFAASSKLEENIEHPIGPLMYTFSTVHCMSVSLAQNGEALGTAWGEQLATQKLKDAGLNHVEVQQLEGDILHNYFVATKQ